MRTLSEKISLGLVILMALFILANIVYGGQFAHQGQSNRSWGRMSLTKDMVFHPLSLNPVVWLDAEVGVESDSFGTQADSGDVAVFWRDGSGNNYDAGQATNANRPVYRTSVHNGNPVLTFGGVDDYLDGSGNNVAGEFTYVMVVASNYTGSRNPLFNHFATDKWGSFAFNYITDQPWLQMAGDNLANWTDLPAQDDAVLHCWLVYVAGSGQSNIFQSQLHIDGILYMRSGESAGSAPEPWDSFEIGHLIRNAVDYYYHGDIALFGVIPGQLNEYQRDNLINWVRQHKGTP